MVVRSNQDILEALSFAGPALIWINPFKATSPPPWVTFSFTGNDENSLLENGSPAIPRSTTGTFFGYGANVIEKTDGKKTPIMLGNVIVGYRLLNQVTEVSGDIIFNNVWKIRSFVLPPGLRSMASFGHGDQLILPQVSMVLLRLNNLNKNQGYYEAHFYYRGCFEPSPIISKKSHENIKMVYNPVAGRDASNFVLPVGVRTMIGWFFNIKADGTNYMVNPSNPSQDVSAPIATYFVPVNIGSGGSV